MESVDRRSTGSIQSPIQPHWYQMIRFPFPVTDEKLASNIVSLAGLDPTIARRSVALMHMIPDRPDDHVLSIVRRYGTPPLMPDRDPDPSDLAPIMTRLVRAIQAAGGKIDIYSGADEIDELAVLEQQADKPRDEIQAILCQKIAKAGHAAIYIPKMPGETQDENRVARAYTVGRSIAGKPDYLVTGMSSAHALDLLRIAIEIGDDLPDQKFSPDFGRIVGKKAGRSARCAIMTVDPEVTAAWAPLALSLGEPRLLRLRILVWPDKQNRLPWEKGYDTRWRVPMPVAWTQR